MLGVSDFFIDDGRFPGYSILRCYPRMTSIHCAVTASKCWLSTAISSSCRSRLLALRDDINSCPRAHGMLRPELTGPSWKWRGLLESWTVRCHTYAVCVCVCVCGCFV